MSELAEPRRVRLPLAMTVQEAKAIAGNLGKPSKMPGLSYGISAKNCVTGSKLRKVPGSVCSGCYAMTDFYATWRPLQEGHARRWRGIHHPRWVDAMVVMISSAYKRVVDPKDRYFRWHDSGDLQGLWHLANIAEVCRRTPDVVHWLPTREYEVVAQYLATGKPIPPNLTIRLSAHMIDAEPVVPRELEALPVSTVSTISTLHPNGARILEGKGHVECRAVEARDNKCGACRACWDPRVKSVNYPQH